ncbi:L-rhamnose mutarotase [Pedobacter sp. SYSU D00535]|uniref:L-rhamnose mutarotase n=1 Tax=Pedobacter sp. SYSU D00535 TaxID=2810308 RepID=UPI001A95FBF0|nr:L-rhamnose mutarotase [Pedobacter sp. SYSU D00535]
MHRIANSLSYKTFLSTIGKLIVFSVLTINLAACKGLVNSDTKSAEQRADSAAAQKPLVMEVIAKSGSLDTALLFKAIRESSIPETAVYNWNNRYVIFGKIADTEFTKSLILAKQPDLDVKVYRDKFYEFSREKHCQPNGLASEWDHTILTANLVQDSVLQQEYLDYHATQFEKWPELSKGFCNANFQQLLIFRNGRQLMLVISIPKGESLDKLNPKTTENNPRVDEWNKLMAKYQEGIEGTKPGETWVFLKPVK